MRGRSAGGPGRAAILAVLLLPGCDLDFGFTSDDGKTKVQGSTSASALSARLAPEPLPADRASVTLPDPEVVLRFTAPLDPASARDAVRVAEEGRGGAPVPVEVRVRDREIRFRPAAGAAWRPGSILSVRVAGLPSLRALRSVEGDPLREEAVLRVAVRSARRADRKAPVLEGSDPAAGAAGVDAAAPVVLRFSEPMDARGLSFTSRGSPWEALRLEADGHAVPFRAFLDRTRREVTLLPAGGLPAFASVEVSLTDRVRDAAGNRLSVEGPRRIEFTTGGGGNGAGLLVEAFEDDLGLDPLGTTVRWNDPAERGVLSGTLEPGAVTPGSITTGAGDEERALRLDPRGGSLRVLVSAADLGDEPRVLRGLHLLPAPGAGALELLDPRVRLLAASTPDPWEEAGAETAPWQEVTEPLARLAARGPAEGIPFVFRHPFRHDGATALMLEITWSGTLGTVLLRAGREEESRSLLAGADPEKALLRASPLLRFDTLGDRAVARSRWMDSGAASPAWGAPLPQPVPAPGRAVVRLQGAPAAAAGAGPDLGRATAWTDDPSSLEGMRWVRFRVVFPGAEPGAPPVVLDRLDLPFVSR